jgi:ATP-dependent protease HslVU (ClpYQ) peptidase subunit
LTTIIAIEREDRVTIAADSRVSGRSVNDGWVQKIVHNGAFTFAAAGYLRAIQVLEYAHLPQPPETNENGAIDRFVSIELVPALEDAFEGLSTDSEAKDHSSILVIVRGRVYEITGGDMAWTRSNRGIYGIGSGSELAIGAVEAGASPVEAIRIAAIYDSGTNSTVTVEEIQ